MRKIGDISSSKRSSYGERSLIKWKNKKRKKIK